MSVRDDIGPVAGRWLPAIAVAALLVAVADGFCRYRFGTERQALMYLAGETIAVDAPEQELDSVTVGESRTVEYALTNLTGRTVRVVGSQSPCSCSLMEQEPDQLPPAETKRVRIKFTPTKAQVSERYVVQVKLFSDDENDREIILSFAAKVEASIKPR